MRLTRDDLKTKAVIRDEALRLYAEHGPAAVTVRQLAAAAGVSPGLVVHHFGSKQGLQEAVDAHVARAFDAMLDDVASVEWGEGMGASISDAVLRRLPAGSPVPAYLRRLLLEGSPAGTELFKHLYGVSRAWMDQMANAGLLRGSENVAMRTAFLLVNDLAVLLLREQLTEVLGVDPLSGAGLTRWAEEVFAVYRDGIFASEVTP